MGHVFFPVQAVQEEQHNSAAAQKSKAFGLIEHPLHSAFSRSSHRIPNPAPVPCRNKDSAGSPVPLSAQGFEHFRIPDKISLF